MDIFGLFVSLFLGLLCMTRFRWLTEFMLGETKNLKSTWLRKWEPMYSQILIFTVGTIIFVSSLSELLHLIF